MDIKSILESTDLPVTLIMWHPLKPPDLPYIVYLPDDSNNFGADNIVYHSAKNYSVELYLSREQIATKQTYMSLVESALTTNDIYFESTETWIQSESMYQVVYSVQLKEEIA